MWTNNLKNLFAAWVLSLVIIFTASGDIIVVNPGESIQAAIDAAADEDEIEVAPGTYNEGIDFKGKAVRLYSRGGPDVTTIDANGIVGAYHVVKCISSEDADTVLEGFTITGGDANGPDPNDKYGGGMYNYDSSPTVTNCTFSGNTAGYGGAMYNYQSNPTVTDCNLSDNSADHGGGIYCESSSPTVTNCTFVRNSAFEVGGMYNHYSSTTVTNCTFSGNTAEYCGGIVNYGGNPMVTNCTFYNNTTNNDGGGMFNYQSSPTVANCTFYNNTANSDGGGIFNREGYPRVVNCTFSGNTAGHRGGGMYNDGSNPIVANCTFSGNRAINYLSGGMYNRDSWLEVTNSIFWGDTPEEFRNDSSTIANVTYSDVQGGWPDSGNIDADPCFVDANNPDPNLLNLRLKPDSPCIDAGNTLVFTLPLDLDEKPRAIDDPHTYNTGISIFGLTVDMGAYEFNPCSITADINCDGVVDFKDLWIICNNWLAGVE